MNPFEEHLEQERNRWLAAGGYKQVTDFDYLNENSIVFEVGFWLGKWSQIIHDLYKPKLYAFEPIKEWYNAGIRMFENDSNVKMFNFGLGDSDKEVLFGLDRDSTGMFCPNKVHPVKIKSVVEFLRTNKIEDIDLFKSNCEGGEYEIFPALIASQEIEKLKHIIIQFHELREEHPEQKKKIQDDLSKTHELLVCYDGIFEFWKRL